MSENSSLITEQLIFDESKKILSTLNVDDLVKSNYEFLKKNYNIKCALILIIDEEKSLLLHRLYYGKNDFYVREFISEEICSNLLLKETTQNINNLIKDYILKSFPSLDLRENSLKDFDSEITNPIMFFDKKEMYNRGEVTDSLDINTSKNIENQSIQLDSMEIDFLKNDKYSIHKEHIFSKNAIIGILLSFYDSQSSEKIVNIDKIYLDFFSIALWNALEHHRILEINKQDYLTGLYNYKEFLNILKQEADLSTRYQTPFSVVFIDLDYFKDINDTYGHLTGTKVIIDVSQILRGDLRQYDCVTRYGGDEFVVLLKKTTKEQAFVVSYRLKHLIENHVFTTADMMTKFNLTASFGIATFPDDGENALDVISRADENMYYVKRNGKNGIKA
ncbi:GGDEF domain-containing protein [bacterium]|nr:GGDEF domain-containing protein [bacterium]